MSEQSEKLGRRGFIGAALGAAAGAGMTTMLPGQASAAEGKPPPGGAGRMPGPGDEVKGPITFGQEITLRDCEVDGRIPDDLQGAFYRVGPDAQYKMNPRNIPFDGEGHVTMFHINNNRVDVRSRYVRNERYLAQDKAGKALFPLYRNPYMDDPSVKGLSRSTANTHIINHRNLLLALKEDSPPTAMDLLTLETLVPTYTFDGQLESQAFTAHPKVDSKTGDIVAFGYEAKGFGSDDINVFQITPAGKMIWSAWVKVPYVGMLHDFAVTENFVIFYAIPLQFDEAQMRDGGIHWSWNSGQPTYFGVMRRYGDGKDIKWFEGPERSATHVMGAFDDGKKVYVDVEMSLSNPFPFMPMRDGSAWDRARGTSTITRLSVDVSDKRAKSYKIEPMFTDYHGALPRQDDRYNTMPYRYGFLGSRDPRPGAGQGNACYVRMDHQTGKVDVYNAGANVALNECCFAPRRADAPEGEGYLVGVAHHGDQGGRADLVILDAQHLGDGPVATVKLPTRIVGQIHGWWVPAAQLPVAGV